MKRSEVRFLEWAILIATIAAYFGQPSSVLARTADYAFFQTIPFADPVHGGKLIKDAEMIHLKRIKGERIYFFFRVEKISGDHLGNVSIQLDNLKGAKVFQVDRWKQMSRPFANYLKNIKLLVVPEILQPAQNRQWHFHLNHGEFVLIIPEKDHVGTGILKIILSNKSIMKFPIKISDIGKEKLASDHSLRGIYFRECLQPGLPQSLSRKDFKSTLAYLKNYGFNSISLYDESIDFALQVLELAKNAGLKGPFPMVGKGAAQGGYQSGNPVYRMGPDEPNSKNGIKGYARWYSKNHSIPLFVSLKPETFDRLEEMGNAPEWANFNVKNLSASDLRLQRKKKGHVETYYWQCYMEVPALNRMYSGFFLYTSKLDGIFPYVFIQQEKNERGFLPDFIPAPKGAARKRFPQRVNKRFYSVYPNGDGKYLSTLQWEAMRQGKDDYRLCLTFSHWLDHLKSAKEGKAQSIRTAWNRKLLEVCGAYDADRLNEYQKYGNQLARRLEDLRTWMLMEMEKS